MLSRASSRFLHSNNFVFSWAHVYLDGVRQNVGLQTRCQLETIRTLTPSVEYSYIRLLTSFKTFTNALGRLIHLIAESISNKQKKAFESQNQRKIKQTDIKFKSLISA